MSRVNTYTFATYSYPVSVQTSPGTTASGTLIEYISVYIPPNLFRVGDTVELSFLVTDANTTSVGDKYCYWNAGTTSVATAIVVAYYASSTTNSAFQPVTRFIHIASPTQSFVGATAQSYLTQMSSLNNSSSQLTNALVTVNIDWTVAGYFFVRGSVTGDRGQYIYVNRK